MHREAQGMGKNRAVASAVRLIKKVKWGGKKL